VLPTERLELAGLTTRLVGPADAPLTVVLLHGFGAPGDDLVALGDALRVPARFVFPEGPLELGGLYGDSRAWWLLDLVRLEAELRAGTPRDRRGEVPEGMADARDHVSRLIDQVKSRLGVADHQLVLGGFSQGAMVALDVALHRETPLAGIVQLSGTLIAESEWQPRLGKLAGVPVFQSHGKNDTLLPYAIAETLRDKLRAAGAAVEWQPFVGGHEIPMGVLGALREFLAKSAAR
jgi:phospholipase/carboxylesterase